jgi:hypothetical protein
MSAFIVSDYHINALVNWACLKTVTYYHDGEHHSIAQHPLATGIILAMQNTASVNARYGDTDESDYIYERFAPEITPLQVLKAVNCLTYQSCETRDWPMTQAFAICEAIKDEAIRSLPGYNEADWELHDNGRRLLSVADMAGGNT